jgi:DNA-binding FrmR family transcriptional regulator
MISDPTLRRLKSAAGQLDGVVRMVEDGRYCIDVLHQIIAVQGALEHARQAVLTDHLRTCVRDAYEEGRVDDLLDELVDTVFEEGRRSQVTCEVEHQ